MESHSQAKENRLGLEKSPYLLQHKQNPVDWYPWGKEAFEKAKREDKLIFLSIGYSTCHWCHVMEKESFEDEEVANLMNQYYVSIKVDREERADIDQIYMSAVQAMAGQGGWPLTVFLTPEGKPFAGGTYFPKEDQWGRPGMKNLLPRMAEVWKQERDRILKVGEDISALLAPSAQRDSGFLPKQEILSKIYQQFAHTFDLAHGGFGAAPKFPRSHELSYLLHFWKFTREPHALEMVQKTLHEMARGGMYDQLGGGFHRYSTDERWLVPHFEKMLYDQAILARTYLEAYQATSDSFYSHIACDIFHYLERDMTHPEGGFFSAEDADSEGEEGKFYVWRPEEINKVLGAELGNLVSEYYGVTDKGNFEHATSVVHIPVSEEEFVRAKKLQIGAWRDTLKQAREKLFQEREKRIHPSKDDKILTGWNGLMISALAMAAQALDAEEYLKRAQKAAEFILKHLRVKGRLMRSWREGQVSVPAFQEDYAFFILGLLDLYEASFEILWLEEALRLTEEMNRLFWDESHGGFFFTGSDAEALIARTKEYYDGAVPSGNSVAALGLLRLSRMLGRSDLEKLAEKGIASNSIQLMQYPVAYPQMMMAYQFALGPSREIVFAGKKESPEFKTLLKVVRQKWNPNQVFIHHPEDSTSAEKVKSLATYLKDQPAVKGKTTVYVCENHVCKQPITELNELKEQI